MPGMETNRRLIDTSRGLNSDIAALRQLDPDIPDFAWRILTSFRPRLSTLQWLAVREFVVTVALAMRPRTADNARRLMTMVGRYAAWLWTVTGLELDLENAFADRHIQRFLAEELGNHSYAHRFAVNRQLAVIAERFTDSRVQRLTAPRSSDRMVPYTDSEIAAMHSWAVTLSTTQKRRNGFAILGLSGGAGLSTAEIAKTRVEHIVDDGTHLLVNVPDPHGRQVPVSASWIRVLKRSVDGRSSGLLFHGYRLDEYPPRAIQSFLTDHRGSIRPSPRQLRLTWLVTQINANLPLPVLLYIAGFNTPSSLAPYMRHANQHSVQDYFENIVGEVSR